LARFALAAAFAASLLSCTGAPDDASPGGTGIIPDTWTGGGGDGGADGNNLPPTPAVVAGVTSTGLLAATPTSVDFGTAQTQTVIHLENSGAEPLHFTCAANVVWLAATPLTGTLDPGSLDLLLSANRAPLASGAHTATFEIVSDEGQATAINVQLTVSAGPSDEPAANPPTLAVSANRLELGRQRSGAFTVSNAGASTLHYNITSDASWLDVSTATGAAAAGAPATVHVVVQPLNLAVGSYEGRLTVAADTGQTRTVRVTYDKGVTSPLIVPWAELNSSYPEWINPDSLADIVDGLREWHKVTNTAVVSTTSEHAWLYTELQTRVPGMVFIPGLKTSVRLSDVGRGFDDPAGWAELAQDVLEVVATSGQRRVLFENETALQDFLNGQYAMDWTRLHNALTQLPADVEYIWYPGLAYDGVDARARTYRLCQTAEDALTCRLVNLGYDDPRWRVYDPWWHAALEALGERPTMPLIYLGCWTNCHWDASQAGQVLSDLPQFPELLFYPGPRWLTEAQTVVQTLDALNLP
jgi:hypothetical protein